MLQAVIVGHLIIQLVQSSLDKSNNVELFLISANAKGFRMAIFLVFISSIYYCNKLSLFLHIAL